MPTSSVKEAVKKQKVNTKDEFDERVRGLVTEFAEQVCVCVCVCVAACTYC